MRKNRQCAGLTQEEFAHKSGLGLRFVRDLEQGKETLRLDKVNQALSMFGTEAGPQAREAGQTPSVPSLVDEKKRYSDAAARTLRKDQRINIRLSGYDLQEIRKLAQAEGIPCQTLISSLLHKYVNGRLTDSR